MNLSLLRRIAVVSTLTVAACCCSLNADGPADNQASSVRPMPPPGIAIPDEVRANIVKELESLSASINELRQSKVQLHQRFLPDVEIFERAVSIALNEDGFFDKNDPDRALKLIAEGKQRATSLKSGLATWVTLSAIQPATVRGFRSKLDGTVQPYGVVYNHSTVATLPIRADVWCRGRSEKGLELQFLATRMTNTDPMPEPGVLMIHPFGRYCNANKLAGEVDTLEALEHAMGEYPIDSNRVAIRGFSMGGAAAWHLAVHYPDKWFAANPGAGFSETPQFLKVFQSEDLKPSWYEQKLWQLYDCPVWVRNLRMLPTVAYSGELDKQKQAADVMAQASWDLPRNERFELTHIVAPKTAHQVDPLARIEIEKRLATIDRLRSKELPKHISFTTTTLKYNRSNGVTIHALKEHWIPATIHVSRIENNRLLINAENITEFSLDFDADKIAREIDTLIVYMSNEDPNAQSFHAIHRKSDLSWGVRMRLAGAAWDVVAPTEPKSDGLRKQHDLQGPIDDAFMSSFVFVKPTAPGQSTQTEEWVNSELQHASREWHRQMRGEVRVKSSDELKPEDIENNHLILWGDPASNPTIAKILDRLPIQWTKEKITIGDRSFDASTHMPALIFPNPLNPARYVVLNSGFTYREYDYLNNARQIPKLPDWAIVDVTTKPDAKTPGRIADADFFGEKWEVQLPFSLRASKR